MSRLDSAVKKCCPAYSVAVRANRMASTIGPYELYAQKLEKFENRELVILKEYAHQRQRGNSSP